MGPAAGAWVQSGRDHRGACRAVGSGYAKSGQELLRRGKVQIADCCALNAHRNGSGSPLRHEQCRTAIISVIRAVAKQTSKLDPLLSVTCNIKHESAVADNDRAAGLRLPMPK